VSDEYDVEAKITVDDKPARAAIGRIAGDLTELYQHAAKTGQEIRKALGMARPEAKAFAATVGIASARMNALAANTTKATAATKPLSGALEHAAQSSARLASQGARTGNVMTGAFQRAGSAGSGLGGIMRSVLGFGAAYVGINALTGAFRGLVGAAFAFQSINDKNAVSIQAVLAASHQFGSIADPVERMAAAGRVGAAVFRELQDDALRSVATSQELASIYTQVSGPLIGAGARLSEVRQITNDTVAAASVLGVDFAQAARDVNLMATGVAGQDTALFRMLKATNAITQSTEQWNAMLPQKRVEAMKEALSKFGPAGKEFEKSLPGITSSFVDFVQRFRGAVMAGPLESVRKLLVRMVGVFQQHQTRILALLSVVGSKLASWMDPAVDRIVSATEWFVMHWDVVASRMEVAWKRLQALGSMAAHYAPSLAAGAKTGGAAMLLGKIAPGAVGGAASAVSAGWGGGAVAGAGALSTGISQITTLISVVAAMGGTFTILLPILAVVIGLVALFADTWSHFVPILGIVWSMAQLFFGGLWEIVSSLFGALMPLLKIVGVIVGSVIALGAVLAFVFLRVFLAVFGVVVAILTGIFNFLRDVFTWIYEHIVGLFTGLLDLIGSAHKDLLPQGRAPTGFVDDMRKQLASVMDRFSGQAAEDKTILGQADAGAPGTRKTTINDFRGSKIEVKQDFRDANPDRVWLQMLDGVNAAADQRLGSALVPEFTR